MARPLGIVSLTLFGAVLASVLTQAVVHSCSRTEVPVATERPVLAAPPGLESPDLLGATPTGRATPAAARGGTALPASLGTATIEVIGSGVDSALGIGIVDGTSGSVRAWHHLKPGSLPRVVELSEIPPGDHWVVLAGGRHTARFSYLARTRIEMADRSGVVSGNATLSANLQKTTIVVLRPEGAQKPYPIVIPALRRTDDPRWSSRAVHGGPTFALREDTAADSGPPRSVFKLMLGAGSYALRIEGVEIAPQHRPRLMLSVPGPDRVTLSCQPQ